MGVVAGPAPETATAVARASTERKLLNLADHLETASGLQIAVGRECVFQTLPGDEIAQFFPRIRNSSGSKQMTLFADTVTRDRLEFRRIDDRPRSGIFEMLFYRTVTAFAGDRLGGKYRCPVSTQSAGDVQRGS